jgi:uncharacterized membrane protein YfcA
MEHLPAYLGIGAVAGILAGLLGIGGGLVIVPALYFLLSRDGVASDVAMQVAVGTSLATIVLTSVSSVLAHQRRHAVRWSLVAQLAPGMMAGALLGAVIAAWLPSQVLARVFALFALLVGIQMMVVREMQGPAQLPGTGRMLASGGVIGTVSALVGIGGGSMTVPFLTWHRVPIHQAIGTSAGCGLPIAAAGTAGFVALGLGHAALPPDSLGYVHLPALAGIVVASVIAAVAGAGLAHRLPKTALRRVFGVFLMLLGFYMLAG